MNLQSKTFFKGIICYFLLAAQLIFINQAHSAGPVGKIDDVDFSNFLLEFANIAVVPGIAFGSSPYFRISYAASMDLLKIACQRMKEAVSLLE